MDGGAKAKDSSLDPLAVRRFLADNPEFLRADPSLLAELGLRPDAANIRNLLEARLKLERNIGELELHLQKHLRGASSN